MRKGEARGFRYPSEWNVKGRPGGTTIYAGMKLVAPFQSPRGKTGSLINTANRGVQLVKVDFSYWIEESTDVTLDKRLLRWIGSTLIDMVVRSCLDEFKGDGVGRALVGWDPDSDDGGSCWLILLGGCRRMLLRGFSVVVQCIPLVNRASWGEPRGSGLFQSQQTEGSHRIGVRSLISLL